MKVILINHTVSVPILIAVVSRLELRVAKVVHDRSIPDLVKIIELASIVIAPPDVVVPVCRVVSPVKVLGAVVRVFNITVHHPGERHVSCNAIQEISKVVMVTDGKVKSPRAVTVEIFLREALSEPVRNRHVSCGRLAGSVALEEIDLESQKAVPEISVKTDVRCLSPDPCQILVRRSKQLDQILILAVPEYRPPVNGAGAIFITFDVLEIGCAVVS